ncbi:MAG TPA: patatin-like phospholipase family protein [Longimicrobiales bacterium]|nr:patatin-like phospholipase family protein [Longimicrobiales bacterium]
MAEGRTILVLGGGGMKGLAHVGAWRALQEQGVQVAEIVGTSIGALVGACVSGGMEADRLSGLARALQKTDIIMLNRWALLFNGIRQPSVFRGDVFRTYVQSVLPVSSFDALTLPLSINAVDLETGEEVWFGAGGRSDATLADAIYASCALPVFYEPAEIAGRHYVDGGITDTLPIARAAARGADRIIAVDVAAGRMPTSDDVVSKGMVAIHQRVMQIMGYARRTAALASWSGPELVYVRPELEGYDTWDFNSTDYFLEAGYQATLKALSGDVPVRERAG